MNCHGRSTNDERQDRPDSGGNQALDVRVAVEQACAEEDAYADGERGRNDERQNPTSAQALVIVRLHRVILTQTERHFGVQVRRCPDNGERLPRR